LHQQGLRTKMTDQAPEHLISKYRYEVLFGTWLLITGGTFLRISRQPYSARLKIEQYESIFKGTSLSAVLLGMGMTPTRSTARRFPSPNFTSHIQTSSKMRIGRGSSSVEFNMWNPIYALAPFVLLMLSIPLGIFAVITTSIAVSLLAGRAFVVYIQLTVALIGAYISPNTDPTRKEPASTSRQWPLTTSPERTPLIRERRHRRNEIISSTSSQETIVPARRSAHLTINSGSSNAFFPTSETTRDFEGVGGWRSPGDEDEEALWMGMNSRLQPPTDAHRRYTRSLSCATSPGHRSSANSEAFRMSPVHSRARTPVRFALENGDDYFPPQSSMAAYAASNVSEPNSHHQRRKSGSSSSSTSSGIMMTVKEAGE
ncbi:hypothetical protein BDU57DRAFT_457956, partial [Ampelomyces quisqualis]